MDVQHSDPFSHHPRPAVCRLIHKYSTSAQLLRYSYYFAAWRPWQLRKQAASLPLDELLFILQGSEYATGSDREKQALIND